MKFSCDFQSTFGFMCSAGLGYPYAGKPKQPGESFYFSTESNSTSYGIGIIMIWSVKWFCMPSGYGQGAYLGAGYGNGNSYGGAF